MNYKTLRSGSYASNGYSLVPLRKEDMTAIMRWRNDQMDVLRQGKALTAADQERYYAERVLPSFTAEHPGIILFSFLLGGACVGYGGLTNIDWASKRAELSFLLETARARDEKKYAEDFGVFLALIKQAAFDDLGFHRLFAETYDIRPLHVAVLEKNGFTLEGRMKDHVFINGRFVDALLHGLLHPRDVQA